MNTYEFPKVIKTYWLLVVGAALTLYSVGRWLLDQKSDPTTFYYAIMLFVCAFNFVACYKNVRSQIILGRICIFALMLWPLLLMAGNLEPARLTTASEVSWASFFLLGALALPISLLGELAIHFVVVSLGLSSIHDLSSVMSITQYFVFETGRYVIWICIQWFWFVPFIMRFLRRKFDPLPAVAKTL